MPKPEDIRVLDAENRFLCRSPSTATTCGFSPGAPGTVRVHMGDREMVYSLTLPDVGEAPGAFPPAFAKACRVPLAADAAPRDLWPWLALLGGIGLLVDWLLYGRSRAFRLRASGAMAPH